MNINDIQVGLAAGSLVLDGNRVFTREEYKAILDAEKMQDHYDLLQLTKKIQL
jgi:hypothetical protein